MLQTDSFQAETDRSRMPNSMPIIETIYTSGNPAIKYMMHF